MAGRPQKDTGTYGGGSFGGSAADRTSRNLGSVGTIGADLDVKAGKPTGTATDKGKQTGMSGTLLNNKYPGAAKKKSKSFAPTVDNALSLVTEALRVTNPLIGAGATALDALAPGVNPMGLSDPLNPFTGQGPDVPSVGAGYAENNAREGAAVSPLGTNPQTSRFSPEQQKKKKVAAKPGFTLLAGMPGTLLGS